VLVVTGIVLMIRVYVDGRRLKMNSKLAIDIGYQYTIITGLHETIKQAVDLSIVPYLEFDGLIRVMIYDPVEDNHGGN
jgi:hypothetical protein